jgi:hypothetical protein
MSKAIFGALGAAMLLAATASGAAAAPVAPIATPAPAHVIETAWIMRCHTVWLRRHRHHHHGWHRVPARSCHRVRI